MPDAATMPTGETISAIERSTMSRVSWRIFPFLMVCYLFAIIDRGNIGMASLQMNEDLGLTKTAFGLASSLFFVSYFFRRSAEQHGHGEVRRAYLDCPHHDHMGAAFRRDRIRS